MPIRVQCNQCRQNLSVPDTLAGKRAKCPCGNIVTVPMTGAVQPTPPPPSRPPVMPSNAPAAGYKGSVTNPQTFKKLYLGILIGMAAVFVSVFLVVVLAIALGASAAGPQIKYQNDLTQWEMNGRTGPKPMAPSAPAGGFMLLLVGLLEFVAFGCFLGLAACMSIFLYKAWSLIQDGNPRTTPGKAVGFLFIPFFNLYWQFVALMGLCDDLNKYGEQRGITARPASSGMMMTALILHLIGCTSPIGAILQLISMNQIKNACMDIAQAKMAA